MTDMTIDRLQKAIADLFAAKAYRHTGVLDCDGREICAGDIIRIDLTSDITKREWWKPEYRVVWKAPSFRLEYVGGDKDSSTARFYFDVPQESSRGKIQTIAVFKDDL